MRRLAAAVSVGLALISRAGGVELERGSAVADIPGFVAVLKRDPALCGRINWLAGSLAATKASGAGALAQLSRQATDPKGVAAVSALLVLGRHPELADELSGVLSPGVAAAARKARIPAGKGADLARIASIGDLQAGGRILFDNGRGAGPDSPVIVIDVGGTHVKFLLKGRRVPRKFDSGPKMTAAQMVSAVKRLSQGWKYDGVVIGYPGPAPDGRPAREPANLGGGWTRYDFEKGFGRPVELINDAGLQAKGSYRGGRMLFLGLGTGLGMTLIVNGVVIPLELAHLPYRNGKSYEDYLGLRGLERLGKKKWRKHVFKVVDIFKQAFMADYVVLGGGNVKQLKKLPPGAVAGSNFNAFIGGFRLWRERFL